MLYKCRVCKKRVYVSQFPYLNVKLVLSRYLQSSLAAYHVVDKHIDVSIYPCRDASGCKYQTIHKVLRFIVTLNTLILRDKYKISRKRKHSYVKICHKTVVKFKLNILLLLSARIAHP